MLKNSLEKLKQDIRYRDRIIVVLFFAIFGLVFAFFRFPSSIQVHHLPDASRLLTNNVNAVPKSSVFSFARLVLETVNYCKTDCVDDIPQNLLTIGNYITESCKAEIQGHMDANSVLFRGRTRSLRYKDDGLTQNKTKIGNTDKLVQQTSAGSWNVDLHYQLTEQVLGYETINTAIHYPVRVVRSSLPIYLNDYGLTLDCFYDEVRRTGNVLADGGLK